MNERIKQVVLALMYQFEMNKEELEDKGVDFNTTYFIGIGFKYEDKNMLINAPEGVKESELLKVISKTIATVTDLETKKEISQIFFMKYWEEKKLMKFIDVNVETKELTRIITPVWIENNMPILSNYTSSTIITSEELTKAPLIVYNTITSLISSYNPVKQQVASFF